MSGRTNWRTISLGTLLILFYGVSSQAQEAQPPQDQQSSTTKGSTSSEAATSPGQQGSNDAGKSTVPQPAEMQVRSAGSSNPLLPMNTSLRWGYLYVRTLDFFQSYDRITNVSSGAQGIFNQGSFEASVFRTAIVYDRPLKQSRLAIEYSPRVTIVNGQISSDYADQNTNINWVQHLNSRWMLGIANSFSYYSVRHLYGDYFLDVNTVTGTNVPSSFLDGGGSWLNTNSTVALSYALSPTSSFSVAPFFSYGYVGGQIVATESYSIYQYGGKFSWQKQLSPSRTISLLYYPRIVRDHGHSVNYESGEVGFSQTFGASTALSLSGGLLSQGFINGSDITFSGSAQLSQRFGHSTASVGYFRGFPLFSEIASQGVAQRVDGTYRLDLPVRWYFQVGGGYEDSLSSGVISVSGKYITSEIGYNLSPQWACYFTYGRKLQSGNNPSLLVGTRDFFAGGIRWTARPLQ